MASAQPLLREALSVRRAIKEHRKISGLGPADIRHSGEKLLAPLRKLATPLADLIQERPYIEMQSLFDDLFTPDRLYYWKMSLLRRVDGEVIDTIVAHAESMLLTQGSFI
jgi:hypothetical protein